MSDDTPTERFDGIKDATPSAPGSPPPRKNARGPLIALIILGVLLVAAVVVVVVILVGRSSGSLSASVTGPVQSPGASDSGTPGPVDVTPTAPANTPKPVTTHKAPPPQPTGAAFTTFVVPKRESGCSGGPDYTGAPPTVKVTWATIRANSAWIVQGTSDAADSQFMQIPLSGNQSDFQNEFDFACGGQSNTYTITLVGQDGKHVSRSWTVKNTSEAPSN